jgi:transcriptional regulator with XRE-family HTH domain/uncharacterized RmlC-like cupin family protein
MKDLNPSSVDSNLKASGANFRSLLNDLKRRPEDAARDLGVSEDFILEILKGERALTPDLIDKALAVWPVNARDFYLLRDDCPSGVKITREAESIKSARVMSRAGREYYEYRDTAMSSVGSFRPEWIQELCVVADNDPENPLIQWNNGHFLHQFTYFVGPVNFYYIDSDGRKKVAVMNTGDSMYITPFVPHTFASRKNDRNELGHILALTYGNKLGGEAQQELSLLGMELAEKLLLDFSTQEKAVGSMIRFHRQGLSLSEEGLATLVKLPISQIQLMEKGSGPVSIEVLSKLARALNVNLRDLLPFDEKEAAVLVKNYSECRAWNFPTTERAAYRIKELCGTPHLSSSKAIEITVLRAENKDLDLEVGLHQYVYNLNSHPVSLHWKIKGEIHTETLHFGDSLYIKPGVPHSFSGKDAQLMVLRIGGRLGGDSSLEFSHVGKSQLSRILCETIQWYNPKGRQDLKAPVTPAAH